MGTAIGSRVTAGSRVPGIADYALIGDCHSAALISKQGSIDWCCMRRLDAGSVFGRLLDWNHGGHSALRPTGEYEATRLRRRLTHPRDHFSLRSWRGSPSRLLRDARGRPRTTKAPTHSHRRRCARSRSNFASRLCRASTTPTSSPGSGSTPNASSPRLAATTHCSTRLTSIWRRRISTTSRPRSQFGPATVCTCRSSRCCPKNSTGTRRMCRASVISTIGPMRHARVVEEMGRSRDV